MDKDTELDDIESKNLQTTSNSGCDGRESDDVPRAVWARKAEYILSLVGFSVGLGVLWRFPYLCMRNGGAFLIPFFFFMLICGFPLYFMELCLGQFSGKSPLVVWCICPLLKGIGYCMVSISFIMTWYYGLVVAWILCYLFYSFYPTQPWASCDNSWNTENCVVLRSTTASVAVDNKTGLMNVSSVYSNTTVNKTEVFHTAANEFWRYRILGMSTRLDDVGPPQWHLVLTLFLSALGTFLCVVRGVRSVGKVAYITATLPYILLTVMLVRSLTLEGSLDGVIYYLKPDFSKLLTFRVWFEAALQVFYSLGPGWGAVITMASYNKFHNNCLRDAAFCTLVDCFSNFFCGFVVFSILGFLAHESGSTIQEVAQSGPGLVFQVYPEALARLPLPNLWAVLFFVTLVAVGLDSQLETVLGGLRDLYPQKIGRRPNLVLLAVFCVFFLISLVFATSAGVYIFTLVDWYAPAYCFFIVSLLECVIVAWLYGTERFSRDIEIMTGRGVSTVFRLSWCVVSPIAISIALFGTTLAYEAPSYNGYAFPKYAEGIGVLIALVSVVPIPIMALQGFIRTPGSPVKRLWKLLTPNHEWGPNNDVVRSTYEKYRYPGDILSMVQLNLFGRKT